MHADARIEVLPQRHDLHLVEVALGDPPFGVASTCWAGTYPLKYSYRLRR
jgi:hypothetical protein